MKIFFKSILLVKFFAYFSLLLMLLQKTSHSVPFPQHCFLLIPGSLTNHGAAFCLPLPCNQTKKSLRSLLTWTSRLSQKRLRVAHSALEILLLMGETFSCSVPVGKPWNIRGFRAVEQHVNVWVWAPAKRGAPPGRVYVTLGDSWRCSSLSLPCFSKVPCYLVWQKKIFGFPSPDKGISLRLKLSRNYIYFCLKKYFNLK